MTFSEPIEKKIKQISAERHLGASQAVGYAADCFRLLAVESEAKTPEAFWNELFAFCRKLVLADPDRGPLFSLCNSLLSAVQEEIEFGHSVKRLKEAVADFAGQAPARLKEAHEKICLAGLPLIEEEDTILTHSYSSAVKDLLIKAHRRGISFQVIATESRPALEGKQLAEELERQGIITTVIIDAACFEMMGQCQKVFVGADRVSEAFFVNKVGTRGIAVSAKEAGRNFYVVCDTSKFVPGHVGVYSYKQHPPEELVERRFPNLIVENPYSEVIPNAYVVAFVTENGLIPPPGVEEYLQEKVHFPGLFESQ